jgi:glycerol-3-phosphate O-acyltransferase / dihydroxyacetone phosphate acyltransferase
MMALGAMANDSSVKVKIVPVGLSYFHPHRFRSRAVVEFGAAMDVPEELVNMFKEGGPSKRVAVGKLLELIYDGLKTVTVRAPDYDTLMVSHNTVFPPQIAHQFSSSSKPLVACTNHQDNT